MTPGLFERDRSWTLALMLAMALALALRFTGLGTWSFASDELGTFNDVRMFHGEPVYGADDPDRNVPKMVPLAMAILSVGHAAFGTDEAGARTMPALFGLAQIALVAVGLRALVGRSAALATALLLTLAPEHIFYCQYHRFYAFAAFCGTAAMLAAARSIRNGSAGWMAVAVLLAFAGVLTQTLLGVVFGGLLLAASVSRLVQAGPTPGRPLLGALFAAVLAAVFAAVYLYPLGRGKAVGYGWEGYSVARAILSGVNQVGWPIALLALPGLLILWRRDRGQACVWGALAFVWAVAFAVLPVLLPFHSAYVFPLCVAVFVLAGVAIGEIVDRVAGSSKAVAVSVLACLLLFDLPSVVSYYQDGNRHDFRAAANWVADRVGPNDLIVAVQGDKLDYYRPELKGRWQRLPYRDMSSWLDERRPKEGKVWIVLPGGRGGLPEPWREWAERNGRRQTTIVHRRFDYHEYPIFILVEDRSAS